MVSPVAKSGMVRRAVMQGRGLSPPVAQPGLCGHLVPARPRYRCTTGGPPSDNSSITWVQLVSGRPMPSLAVARPFARASRSTSSRDNLCMHRAGAARLYRRVIASNLRKCNEFSKGVRTVNLGKIPPYSAEQSDIRGETETQRRHHPPSEWDEPGEREGGAQPALAARFPRHHIAIFRAASRAAEASVEHEGNMHRIDTDYAQR